jgi:hypothetical protein
MDKMKISEERKLERELRKTIKDKQGKPIVLIVPKKKVSWFDRVKEFFGR